MRNYILTSHEKKIAEEFIESGKKLNGFRLLYLRMKQNLITLEDDLKLIKFVLEKGGDLV